MNRQPKYCFYATLLDKYEGYINSSRIYNEYWGFSENPPHTEEEFTEIQRLSLIDTINRVPFDSEDADRGTAFNEVVDCMICRNYHELQPGVFLLKGEKTVSVVLNEKKEVVTCINGYIFNFPLAMCKEFADYFKGAIPQLKTEGILDTRYGDVLLYGYIDESMPMAVHDIKMTKRYSVGKFRHNWQHIVYPFCLNRNGNTINDFEYNVAHINILKSGFFYDTYTEHYAYVEERDVPRLRAHVEGLIEFVEEHRSVITDKKIFNYE